MADKKKSEVRPSAEDILSALELFGDDISIKKNRSNANAETESRAKAAAKRQVESGGFEVIAEPKAGHGEGGNADENGRILFTTYQEEWESLFGGNKFAESLRQQGVKGNLRSSRFRSICWKVYLDCLPEDVALWVEHTRRKRSEYDNIRNKHLINPHGDERQERNAAGPRKSDLNVNNPLSQDDQSPWAQYFSAAELRGTIEQDVERTYPELEFFHEQKLQQIMTDILFCYGREHPDICYKQGMHELLAPVLFVLHCDHQAYMHASETQDLGEVINAVLDPSQMEHDAYLMFYEMMETAEPWYQCKELPSNDNKVQVMMHTVPFSKPLENPSNQLVTKLTRIEEYLLQKHDPQLYHHLERLEIAPQIYGIRWIRLLFGREFPLQELLVLWDAIFSDSLHFGLVDYIFVAMLIYIRHQLLSKDYPQCLMLLMKYPPVADVFMLIEQGLHMRNPVKYPRPLNFIRQVALSEQPTSSADKMTVSASSAAGGHAGKKAGLWGNNLRGPGRGPGRARPAPADTLTVTTAAVKSPTGQNGAQPPLQPPPRREFNRQNSLPSARKKSLTKQEQQDLSREVIGLRDKITQLNNMCTYCASKMDIHIDCVQEQVSKHVPTCDDGTEIEEQRPSDVLLALAGLKQVRDILKGTLMFSPTLLEQDKQVTPEPKEWVYLEDDSTTVASVGPVLPRPAELREIRKNGDVDDDEDDMEVISKDGDDVTTPTSSTSNYDLLEADDEVCTTSAVTTSAMTTSAATTIEASSTPENST